MKRNSLSFNALRAAVLSLSIAGLAAPALATDPAPAAPAAAPAAAPVISPAQLELGRQLAEASGATKSFDGVVNSVIDQTLRNISQTRPELKQPITEIITQIRPEIDAQKKEITDVAAKIFASDLSEAELKDSVAFFTSPSGKKYVTSQPDMLNKLVAVMQAWQQNLGAALVNRLRIELKKKNIDL